MEATRINLQTITANKKTDAKIIHPCQGREAMGNRPVWERFPKGERAVRHEEVAAVVKEGGVF